MIKKDIIVKYQKAARKLILLDYDGTLVNYENIPDKAKLTKQINNILINIIKNPFSKVIIITGRGYQDIDNLLSNLPLDIIAEHGAMIKENGKWKKIVFDKGLWKKNIQSLFNKITSSCPGSFIEEKRFSLSWHYRNAEPEMGYNYSRMLINSLDKVVDLYNLKILDSNKAVEVMSIEIGKGKAIKRIVEQNNYDFILSIGDDITDEEMFEYLLYNKNAVTFKVGKGKTTAKYKLDNVEEVITLLEQLSLVN
jgi:trehalose 6-phosphate synthase/phosphatase